MLKRGVWTIVAAAVLVLFTPRTGSAGIGEWIWEMSGPPMVGGGLECKFNFHFELEICYVTVPVGAFVRSDTKKVRYRMSIEGGIYGSLGKKSSSGVEYKAGDAWMFAFDPMLELVHHDNKAIGADRVEIYHGVGLSFNRVVGDFQPSNHWAIKTRPIGVRFGRNNLEFDLRFYPTHFSATDFGHVPVGPEPTGLETVGSLSYGIAIGKYKPN